jgi:hypothetical protein
MVWTSLFGIITLVLLARALGFAKTPVLADADAARRIAGDAINGFCATDVAVARDGRSAIVAGHDGRIAVVRPVGDRWVVRLVDGAKVGVDAGRLQLTFPEPMFAPVVVDLGSLAPLWAARL